MFQQALRDTGEKYMNENATKVIYNQLCQLRRGNFTAAKICQVTCSSNFTAATIGQISYNMTAAKIGQISSNMTAVKLVKLAAI